MNFKIHRGANEIGGSCVEVRTASTRIVVDLGMPLVNGDRTPFDARETESRSTDELIAAGVLPNIPSLYSQSADGPQTALLISHAHQDHYGLMGRIDASCPVYLGFATKLLIELTNTFTGKEWTVRNAHHIDHEKRFSIGDIEITPYLMDHAAFDAYAFLIESGGKSLFYSGDFRMHGRKAQMFDWFRDHFKSGVDCLLLEGSTIDRGEEPFQTESELEDEFAKTFRETTGICLVYVSGQNIDRLVTIYRACKKTGRIFLIDFYVANVLKTLSKKAKSNRLPFPSGQTFPEVKVWFPHFLTDRMEKEGKKEELVYPFAANKIGRDKIEEMAGKLVMLVRPSARCDLEKYLQSYSDGCFIYSQWNGYKKQPGKTKDFIDFVSGKGMPIKDIHTSGHADVPALKRMVETVKPKRIVPIHTFDSGKYAERFSGSDVEIVGDGVETAV